MKNWRQKRREAAANMPGSSRSATNRRRQTENRTDTAEATNTAAPRPQAEHSAHAQYILELKIKRIRWIQCDWGSAMFDIFPLPLLKSDAYLSNGTVDASALGSVSQLPTLTLFHCTPC